MKKLYSIIALSFTVLFANATVHTITVNSSFFSPATVNAVCGDTVTWVHVSGTHTTTSVTIPVCATAWDAPISSTDTTFTIVIPCEGTYNYKCTPHGFTGTIVVSGSCTTGIASINSNYFSAAYPNPFSGKLTIEVSDADMVYIYNSVGEKIRTITLQQGQTKAEINSDELREGIYFYSIIRHGAVIRTRKIVKR